MIFSGAMLQSPLLTFPKPLCAGRAKLYANGGRKKFSKEIGAVGRSAGSEKTVQGGVSMRTRMAGVEARTHFENLIGTSKLMPCYKTVSPRVLQAVRGP
jgi:hypothetical protein